MLPPSHFDDGQFVEQWDDESARKGYCLYKMGCKGPTTYNACSTVRWNGGVSFPIQSGHGLHMVLGRGVLGQGPFYDRLTEHPPIRRRENADEIGLAAAGSSARPSSRMPRRPPLSASSRRTTITRPDAALLQDNRHDATAHLAKSRSRSNSSRRSRRRRNGFARRRHAQRLQLDNSGKRIVVDPVTRIEGHLRIEVNVDSNNVIRNAVSTGTMWRGIEVILKNRDPRDAGPSPSGFAAFAPAPMRSLRSAPSKTRWESTIPENANSIRNLMQLALQVHDHIVHFYHLHALDWVDVVSALRRDPKSHFALAQSISSWPLSPPAITRNLQTRLKKFVESGQLGPFKKRLLGQQGL